MYGLGMVISVSVRTSSHTTNLDMRMPQGMMFHEKGKGRPSSQVGGLVELLVDVALLSG